MPSFICRWLPLVTRVSTTSYAAEGLLWVFGILVAAGINPLSQRSKNLEGLNFLSLCIAWEENTPCLAGQIFSHAFVQSPLQPSSLLHAGEWSSFSANWRGFLVLCRGLRHLGNSAWAGRIGGGELGKHFSAACCQPGGPSCCCRLPQRTDRPVLYLCKTCSCSKILICRCRSAISLLRS